MKSAAHNETERVSVPRTGTPAAGGVQRGIRVSNTETNRCLHEIFEAAADQTPSATALECGELVLSYEQVERVANQLARYLRDQGVSAGSLVGVCLERSHWPLVTVIAILKTGAAYVPIEPTLPEARISYIANTAELALILTDHQNISRVQSLWDGISLSIDEFSDVANEIDGSRLSRVDGIIDPASICYVLFTSGTTGRPKGVVTEHRNAVHFVHAFNEVCTTTSADRVFQGFALSFDGSVEEMWMAFSNCATLVCGDRTTPRFGEELSQFLDENRITFFSTVPTLLATLPGELPHLRQLVLSGEACPPELVKRWAKPFRTMLNVYGPTEATVNTTASVLMPDRPVTIGRALPGYATYILDDTLRPAPEGELFIAGPTLCRGYLNDNDQTSRAFVLWSEPGPTGPASAKVRLYRTGDLVRKTDAGELEFLGRIDGQVKIRGFRVELSEIDAVLVEIAEIAAAATTMHERDGQKVLAAHITLADGGADIDRTKVRAALAERLPAYMVPNFLDVINQFPRLASGKIDRKRLPPPQTPLVAIADDAVDALTTEEKATAAVWSKHLQVASVAPNQNFFTELGGHSLVAARVASELQKSISKRVAVRDLYANPTVRSLTAALAGRDALEAVAGHGARTSSKRIGPNRPVRGWAVVPIQVLYLLAVIPVLALPVIYLIPLAIEAIMTGRSVIWLVLLGILTAGATWAALIAVAICAKWLLIGRYKPGRYPLWGRFYICWWIASRLQHLSNLTALNGTPFAPLIWRAMGAKVGRHCMLNASLVYGWDCISLGDHVSIGTDTHVAALRIENGEIVVGAVRIGDRCFVGNHSVLGLDVTLGDDVKLDDQSALPDGASVAAGTSCRGSPASPQRVLAPEGPPLSPRAFTLAVFGVVQLIAGASVTILILAPIAVAFAVAVMLFVHQSTAVAVTGFLLLVPASIIVFALWTAAIKKLVHPILKPGKFKRTSIAFLRYWLLELVLAIAKVVGRPIFTTLYLPPWMRLLGARLGRNTEMSTVWRINPDLLEAGDEVFFADGCNIGEGKSHLGWVNVDTVSIGNRSFVGNSATLSIGDKLGDDCLLGVLSTMPSAGKRVPDGTDWLGSPGFQLPSRQKVTSFAREQTYNPSRKLYLQRALIDGLRVVLPGYVFGALAVASVLIVMMVYQQYGIWGAYSAITLLPWVAMAVCVTTVVGLKWLIMGTFAPVVVPLWCTYVWWNEFINGLYEALLAPYVAIVFGTPFASVLLRLLGCKIGSTCYIETNLFSEFDLVHIGNHVALNAGVVVQNHLFEDRVMKSASLKLSDGCSLGNMSVVLYDTVIGDDAVLGSLSLLMKGETMPPGARWHGIPTVSI